MNATLFYFHFFFAGFFKSIRQTVRNLACNLACNDDGPELNGWSHKSQVTCCLTQVLLQLVLPTFLMPKNALAEITNQIKIVKKDCIYIYNSIRHLFIIIFPYIDFI